jgi:hypothetical protein
MIFLHVKSRLIKRVLSVAALCCVIAEPAMAQVMDSELMPRPSLVFAWRGPDFRTESSGAGESSMGTVRRYGREGLIIGLAIGAVSCAIDPPGADTCKVKIPLSAIVGFAIGQWLIPARSNASSSAEYGTSS